MARMTMTRIRIWTATIGASIAQTIQTASTTVDETAPASLAPGMDDDDGMWDGGWSNYDV